MFARWPVDYQLKQESGKLSLAENGPGGRRETKKLEDALVSLAQAVGTVTEPSEKMITPGVMGWNAAIQAMEQGLTVVGEA